MDSDKDSDMELDQTSDISSAKDKDGNYCFICIQGPKLTNLPPEKPIYHLLKM